MLDIGGGPGRYTIWLAERGYTVVLADLSPNLLDHARANIAGSFAPDNVEEIVGADARDLSRWTDASFDAALCLGPMYHLPDAGDRVLVARELWRVLKAGAPAFVAWMPRMLFLRRSVVVPEERRHLLDEAFVDAVRGHGRFDNDVPGRFDHGYGAAPGEITPFMEDAGFDTLELLASESFAATIGQYVEELARDQPEVYPRLLALLSDTANDPGLLSTANHLLWFGHKR